MTVSDELLSLALFLPCLVFSQHNYLGVIVYVQGFIQTFWQGGQSGVLGGGGVSHDVDRSEVISNPKGGYLGSKGEQMPPLAPLNETLMYLELVHVHVYL